MKFSNTWWALCVGFFFGWCSVQFASGWKLEIALVEPPSPLERILDNALEREMRQYQLDEPLEDVEGVDI